MQLSPKTCTGAPDKLLCSSMIVLKLCVSRFICLWTYACVFGQKRWFVDEMGISSESKWALWASVQSLMRLCVQEPKPQWPILERWNVPWSGTTTVAGMISWLLRYVNLSSIYGCWLIESEVGFWLWAGKGIGWEMLMAKKSIFYIWLFVKIQGWLLDMMSERRYRLGRHWRQRIWFVLRHYTHRVLQNRLLITCDCDWTRLCITWSCAVFSREGFGWSLNFIL